MPNDAEPAPTGDRGTGRDATSDEPPDQDPGARVLTDGAPGDERPDVDGASTGGPPPPGAAGPPHHAAPDRPVGKDLAKLTLGALGIVYGDIGTSPLYAMRESFEAHDLAVLDANVLGVLSLIFWSMMLVITVKYLLFVMRADNGGEGGILALAALVTPVRTAVRTPRTPRWILVMVGLFGTALLYGDGMITPAISVLSAVEGLSLAAPSVDRFVIPIACLILVGLFSVQSRGTGTVGTFFGPIMVVWFAVLAILGLIHIGDDPGVLAALNPTHAVQFFGDNGMRGFLVLGSVFLVVTGGEALYADMGHFGRRPIQMGWFFLALPALVLNYLGQGALVMKDHEAVANPFYLMAPHWARLGLTLLATMATVIASQALISGVFSITMQAVQLGYSPRLRIQHTSATQAGQIYIPAVNWALMAACIALVVTFRSSSALAAAYGVAVTATMFITTLLLFVVARERWGWSLPVSAGLCGTFLVADVAFLGANLFKIPHGGWFPLVVGVAVFVMLTTWRTGRALVREQLRAELIPLGEFVERVTTSHQAPARVEGTAVFMYSEPGLTPPALATNVRHNRVLHERTIVLSVVTLSVPRLPPDRERVDVTDFGSGFCQFRANFGFMEKPELPAALQTVEGFDLERVTFFLGSEMVTASNRSGMARWREKLFALMLRNASGAANFFDLPYDRTVVVGVRLDI